jgi:hypothetical protein
MRSESSRAIRLLIDAVLRLALLAALITIARQTSSR